MVTTCIFCKRQAILKNPQGFPVCVVHKKEELPEMKCVCNDILSMKESRYGSFFICPSCGPVSLKKALEVNQIERKESPKHITIRSDEVDLF